MYKKFLFISSFLNVFIFGKLYAADINANFNATPDDSSYDDIVKPIVNPTRFQFMSAPVPRAGKIIPFGISAGVGISYFDTPSSLKTAIKNYTDANNNFSDSIYIPRFIGIVGLPFGVDLAINYAKIPDSSLEFTGAAIQYSFYNSKLLPISIAARLGYTQISGYSLLTADTTNVEALVSLPIILIKPYLGIGSAWSNAKTDAKYTSNSISISLNKSTNWNEIYTIIGVQVSALAGLSLEGQFSSTQTVFNAKFSIDL